MSLSGGEKKGKRHWAIFAIFPITRGDADDYYILTLSPLNHEGHLTRIRVNDIQRTPQEIEALPAQVMLDRREEEV